MPDQCRGRRINLCVTGKIEFLHLPGGRGVRLDTHIYSGYTISISDSMVAKLIVHGKDRMMP